MWRNSSPATAGCYCSRADLLCSRPRLQISAWLQRVPYVGGSDSFLPIVSVIHMALDVLLCAACCLQAASSTPFKPDPLQMCMNPVESVCHKVSFYAEYRLQAASSTPSSRTRRPSRSPCRRSATSQRRRPS